MTHAVGTRAVNSYSREAQKRGYDEDLKQGYIRDRKALRKKTTTVAKAGIGGAMLVTAGTVGYKIVKARKEKNFLRKGIIKSTIFMAKKMAKVLWGSSKVVTNALKSAPKIATIPALAVLGIAVGKSLIGKREINAKYDSLQEMRNTKKQNPSGSIIWD